MGKRKLNPEELWAQQIFRYQDPSGQDFIAALVFKKFSDFDVEGKGPGQYIGIERKEVFDMVTDNDPDSDTYTQRIQKPDSEPIRTVMRFTDKATPANLEKYKKMAGTTSAGITELIWKFREGAFNCSDREAFWTTPMSEVYQSVVLNKTVVQIVPQKKQK